MYKGFSTLELLLSLTIIATTITATTIVCIEAPAALADGYREQVASERAAALVQSEMQIAFTAYDDVQSHATTTSDGVSTAVTVTQLVDGVTKNITASAEWTDARGRERTVLHTALATDFRNVSPSSCQSVLTGDWKTPRIYQYALSAGMLLPSDFTRTVPTFSSMAVASTTLFVAATSTTSATDPDLYVFSFSSTTQPRYVSSIDSAASTTSGIAAVVADGSYVYAATAREPNYSTCTQSTTCAQLQVFSQTSSGALSLASWYRLATSTAPYAVGSAGQSAGKSITYAHGFVYLGLRKTGSASGEEFNIIDMHNPMAPLWVGGYAVGRSINRIVVRDTTAYLATDDPHAELLLLDIHDPAHPTKIASYDAPGATNYGYGKDIGLLGTSTVLARTYTPNGPQLSLVSPASTTLVAVSSTTPTIASSSVVSMNIRGTLISLLTARGLELWNAADPSHLVPVASPTLFATGSSATAGVCAGAAVYATITAAGKSALTVFTGS